MESEKDQKIQELTHETNKKMDVIAKEMARLKDSDLDEKIKNDKMHALGKDFQALLDEEKKQIQEIVELVDVWKEYTAALVRWKLAFEVWQKAGSEAMMRYNKALQSLGSGTELPQRMGKTWEETWKKDGEKELKRFANEWQNMLKESGIQSIHKFNKDWGKFWSTPGMDPSKTYLEAMRQFIETWQNMWKK